MLNTLKSLFTRKLDYSLTSNNEWYFVQQENKMLASMAKLDKEATRHENALRKLERLYNV